MDKVKAALSDFTSKSGHHDTTVHEAVAPAITRETVKPHQHEEINTAVDREVHQDHYHRTIQPVTERNVLAETHTAKLGGVQHREFDHRDHDTTKRNLTQDQARFKDESRVEATTTSQSVAPTIGGEHVHHHIHETIQPVIHKETVQPSVVHTTVPIHEVHHNKATHHDATSLPTMTMDEFKQKGGVLGGREERYDEFKGVPKNIGGGSAGGFGHVRDPNSPVQRTGSDHHRHGDYDNTSFHHNASPVGTGVAGSGMTGSRGTDPTGPHDSRLGNKADPRVDSDRVGTAGNTVGAGGVGAGQYGSSTTGATGSGLTGTRGTDPTGPHDTHLTNKADPRVDSDRVGTAGNTVGAGGQGVGQYGSSGTGTTGSGLTGTRGNDPTGPHDNRMGNKLDPRVDSDRVGSAGNTASATAGSKGTRDGQPLTTTKSGSHKPSLLSKLNPLKDSDGDGKKGFMD